MKALTIWQPWATLIIEGVKPFEFRGWAPPLSSPLIGQRIVIHAAKRPLRDAELSDIIEYLGSDEGRRDGIKPAAFDILEPEWMRREMFEKESTLPFSAGLGTVRLGEPRLVSSNRDTVIYAWPMLDIEKWPTPVPAKGAQGFWNWKEST